MTNDTDTLLINAVEGLRADVADLSRKVADLTVKSAHDEGLERGLNLSHRVTSVEHQLRDRPTAKEIGEMFDNRMRKLMVRLIAAALAAVPVWMGAGVALAAFIAH